MHVCCMAGFFKSSKPFELAGHSPFGNGTHLFKSLDPPLIKMIGYSIKNKDGVGWYSDPFYTHNEGYKMCLSVYAAGHANGKGTHLSVFLYLMKGPHDDDLTWPLLGKFEIKLLNQISDSEHHSVTISYDDKMIGRVTIDRLSNGWGYDHFISNGNLLITSTRTCQFLKDDCLFFQVTCKYEQTWLSRIKQALFGINTKLKGLV